MGTNYLELELTWGQIAWNQSYFGDKLLGIRDDLSPKRDCGFVPEPVLFLRLSAASLNGVGLNA